MAENVEKLVDVDRGVAEDTDASVMASTSRDSQSHHVGFD